MLTSACLGGQSRSCSASDVGRRVVGDFATVEFATVPVEGRRSRLRRTRDCVTGTVDELRLRIPFEGWAVKIEDAPTPSIGRWLIESHRQHARLLPNLHGNHRRAGRSQLAAIRSRATTCGHELVVGLRNIATGMD